MMEKCPRSAIMLDWRYGLDDGPPLENYGKNRAIFLKRHDKSKYFSPLELTYTYLELSCSIGRGSDNCWLAILEIKSFSQGFPLKQILLIKTLCKTLTCCCSPRPMRIPLQIPVVQYHYTMNSCCKVELVLCSKSEILSREAAHKWTPWRQVTN